MSDQANLGTHSPATDPTATTERDPAAPSGGMLAEATRAFGAGVLQRRIRRRAAERTEGAGAADHEGAAPDLEAGAKAPATDDTTKEKKDAPALKSDISADAGFKILKDAFGDLKKDVSQGSVKVLGQADFQVAYDAVYGKTDYSWDKYIKPKFGNVRGFAHDGVNYINKDEPSIDVGTVVHEMLHNNTASDWTGVVGNQFDEGTTEYLTVFAMKKAGKPRASGYAKQLDIVNTVVGSGLADADIKTAYLKGGAQRLVADWFTGAMASSWADFKADMQSEDYAKAKLKIKKKAGGEATK